AGRLIVHVAADPARVPGHKELRTVAIRCESSNHVRTMGRHKFPMKPQTQTMKRLLDADSLRAMARGCGVLGAGGGGDPYLDLLHALQAAEDYGPAPLVDLDELPDDLLIMPCGGVGAPMVVIEKIANGTEGARLRDQLEHLTGRRVGAIMAAEIGGGDGPGPVALGRPHGTPGGGADGSGRAF